MKIRVEITFPDENNGVEISAYFYIMIFTDRGIIGKITFQQIFRQLFLG